jgi:hypothetical protein
MMLEQRRAGDGGGLPGVYGEDEVVAGDGEVMVVVD